ncbi:IS5 family transposase [Methylobacterium sp. IF7SW-B2]|nr:IS5 family transposase [Methylobacterium ajmalii]MBK3409802.1 IS5 family transposase [Methylobacterium ajmalii]MBK3425378.1 IS5 family transposase [Methylobacterium ajmalii]
MLDALAQEADLDCLMRDATIVRATVRLRARARSKGANAQGPGRSRGGLTTKIHAATDGLGLPVRLIGGPGPEHDATRGSASIDGFEPGSVIADKGYVVDRLVEVVSASGATVVIPPRRNRKVAREFDRDVYKERNQIECFFNKLKRFRWVATRYDKLLVNDMGFVKPAAIAIWLR